MRVGLVIVLAVMSLSVFAATVHADTAEADKRAAAAHYRQGRTYADAGDYERAIAEYTKANEILPKPLLLFHIAEAYRLKGDLREALMYYQQYLEAEPNGKPAGAVRELTTSLRHDIEALETTKDGDGDDVPDVRDRCPTVAAHTPDGCPDRDGDGISDDRDRCPDTAAAGTPDGCLLDRDGDGVPDDRDRCPAVRGVTADGCPAVEVIPGHLGRRRLIALTVGSAGLVGLTTSGIFGLHARSLWNDARQTCTATACDPAGHDKAASANQAATISTVMFGLGTVALVTGVYLYFTAPRETSRQSTHITPTAGNGTVGLGVTRVF